MTWTLFYNPMLLPFGSLLWLLVPFHPEVANQDMS